MAVLPQAETMDLKQELSKGLRAGWRRRIQNEGQVAGGKSFYPSRVPPGDKIMKIADPPAN